mgnify:CR=1
AGEIRRGLGARVASKVSLGFFGFLWII